MGDYLRSNADVTPRSLSEMTPFAPIWTTPPAADGGMIAQLYRYSASSVAHGGLNAHGLVIGMNGQSLVTDTTEGCQRQAWCLPGCFSLTPAGQPLERSWLGRPEAMVVLLDTDMIAGVGDELECRGRPRALQPAFGARDGVIHGLASVLQTAMTQPAPGMELMVEVLARALGVHLLRHYSANEIPTPRSLPRLTAVRLRRVAEFMTDNLHRSVSLSELAAVCGLSRTHFGRAFKEATGQAPHGFLTRLRMEKAQQMLSNSRRSVSEVADQCGFSQPQYFATVFQRQIGMTPSAWRREHGQ